MKVLNTALGGSFSSGVFFSVNVVSRTIFPFSPRNRRAELIPNPRPWTRAQLAGWAKTPAREKVETAPAPARPALEELHGARSSLSQGEKRLSILVARADSVAVLEITRKTRIG